MQKKQYLYKQNQQAYLWNSQKNHDHHFVYPPGAMTANGLQFTVTGLDSGTHYALTILFPSGRRQR